MEEGRKTRTHPDVRPSPYSAALQFLFVYVPAWHHPPCYLLARDNQKESQCLPGNKDDVGHRQPEVATGTYFAPYLGQHCARAEYGKGQNYAASAPHIKHSRLRGHATTRVSRSSMQGEVKASASQLKGPNSSSTS